MQPVLGAHGGCGTLLFLGMGSPNHRKKNQRPNEGDGIKYPCSLSSLSLCSLVLFWFLVFVLKEEEKEIGTVEIEVPWYTWCLVFVLFVE